jgi:hypothetical protein
LHNKHDPDDVRVLIIDVLEPKAVANGWADGHGLTFPVLIDTLGKVSETYAPEGVLPDLPRYQIPIGSNLLIDREGRIQFYSLLDSRNFDARLIALRKRLYSFFDTTSQSAAPAAVPSGSRVLTVDAPGEIRIQQGSSAIATVSFRIHDGYHVLADGGNDK